MVSEAVARGDVAALNYFIAEKYLKAFGKLAQSPNQKMLMLPIEAMNVLGSLAGIGEIAKATFGGDGKRRRRPPRRRAGRPARAGVTVGPGIAAEERDTHDVAGSSSLGSWNWFILAAFFLLLELLAPGTFMLWLGLSAMLVGAHFVRRRLALADQLIAFAVFAIASIPMWRRFARRVEKPVDQPFLNRRAEASSAASSRWRSRSSTASARCASTTRSGGSPVRMPGRQPREGRARRWRGSAGGGEVAEPSCAGLTRASIFLTTKDGWLVRARPSR